jgi:hypothetical protein
MQCCESIFAKISSILNKNRQIFRNFFCFNILKNRSKIWPTLSECLTFFIQSCRSRFASLLQFVSQIRISGFPKIRNSWLSPTLYKDHGRMCWSKCSKIFRNFAATQLVIKRRKVFTLIRNCSFKFTLIFLKYVNTTTMYITSMDNSIAVLNT